jgi:hypothetical protein
MVFRSEREAPDLVLIEWPRRLKPKPMQPIRGPAVCVELFRLADEEAKMYRSILFAQE